MALTYLLVLIIHLVLKALTKLAYLKVESKHLGLKNKPAKAEVSVNINLAIFKFMELEKFPGIFLFVFVMSSITSL